MYTKSIITVPPCIQTRFSKLITNNLSNIRNREQKSFRKTEYLTFLDRCRLVANVKVIRRFLHFLTQQLYLKSDWSSSKATVKMSWWKSMKLVYRYTGWVYYWLPPYTTNVTEYRRPYTKNDILHLLHSQIVYCIFKQQSQK